MVSLVQKFGENPFSVFDTQKLSWLENKKKWLKLGITSHLGRNACTSKNLRPDNRKYFTSNKVRVDYHAKAGQEDVDSQMTGTSVFDPVLCELIYNWFVPINGTILDPFAGGSVRGIVANYLGYKYTGIELRSEQIDANIKQCNDILFNTNKPRYILGDSRNISNLISETYDMVFSCPPYYNLEVYSNDKNDLSNCSSYNDFINNYKQIITDSVSKLKNDRFACFVVSDIRDKNGFYYGFVSDTIKAFQEAGIQLYNEIILLQQYGSVPICVQKYFVPYRKVGRVHQNVLIFYKGDVKKIPENYKFKDNTNQVTSLLDFR